MPRIEGQYDFGFDLDDVLFSCVVPLIEKVKEAGWIPQNFTVDKLEKSRLYEQFGWKEYRETIFLTEEFTKNQETFPEVLEDILTWRRMGARICFITARQEPAHLATKEVMAKLGFQAGCIYFGKTTEKHIIAKDLGLLLFVDDMPESSLKMAEVIPYSFSMPYKFNEYLKEEIRSKKISNLYREDWDTTADLISAKGIRHSVFNLPEKYVEQ